MKSVLFFGICEENGILWLSTNNGFMQFNPAKLDILQFNEADGLQSNGFEYNNYYQSLTGRMYFGGAYGINTFFAQNIIRNDHVPPIYITSIETDNVTK